MTSSSYNAKDVIYTYSETSIQRGKLCNVRLIYILLNRIIINCLMVFSFLQRRCHSLTRCLKKIANQHCYNVIFYLKRREHKYYKTVCLCLPPIKKCCQIDTFSTSFFEYFFYNQKQFFFNTEYKFFILLTM